MTRTLRSPSLILLINGLLLGIFFLAAQDVHKQQFIETNKSLSSLRLSILLLSDSFHKVRSGFFQNYDQLSSDMNQLITRTENLKNIQGSDKKTSGFYDAVTQFQRKNTRPFTLSTDQLTTLTQRKNQLVNQYKSDFAISKNTYAIMIQLVEELISINNSTDPLNDKYKVLEIHILKAQLPNLDKATHHKNITALINQLKSQNLTSLESEYLDYLIRHNQNAIRHGRKAGELVRDYLEVEDDMLAMVGQIESALLEQYQGDLQSRQKYVVGMFISLTFLLIFGGIQAFQKVRYSRALELQKESLEDQVKKRTEELDIRESFFRAITETASEAIILCDTSGGISFVNAAAMELFEYTETQLIGAPISKILPSISCIDDLLASTHMELDSESSTGKKLTTRISANQIDLVDGYQHVACILHNLTDIKALEKELSHAHKLEAVGQLAAGIAHEINTPAQFISDNLVFLRESVGDLFALYGQIDVSINETAGDAIETIRDALAEADIDFLKEEIPSALDQSYEGIERVANIVRAMKNYAHPGESMEASDLNAAINSTTIISKSEWKYFANMETDFQDDLPLVECIVSDINQVVLNMIVNAAHAIVDKHDDATNKTGLIKIATKSEDDSVLIYIEDNGSGMPPEVQDKIFDQFYTTKGVGKGTGQGLSIVHNIIVVKHGGSVTVDSTPGEGTRFAIRLPVKQARRRDEVLEVA